MSKLNRYSSYKDSGVEWIGEIPREWEITKMKYLVVIGNGRDFKDIEVEEGGFPVLGTGGEFSRCSDYLYKGPSVLLGRKGTINKPQIIYEPFWTSDTLYYTIINQNILPELLFHLVNQIQFDFYEYGSTIPSMTKTDYEDMKFTLPPLKEQQEIVSYLDKKTSSIDSLIQSKEKKITLLKEKRTSLINQVVTKGLNPDVEMKDSGVEWIGSVPRGWKSPKLRFYTTKIGSGSTPRGGSEIYEKEGVPFIRSQNVHFSGLSLENVSFITDEIHLSMSGSKVKRDDVLLNITGGSIGRCCLVDVDFEMNVNQHVSIIRTKDSLSPKFLNYLLYSDIGQKQVEYNVSGGNREGLTIDGISNFFIPFPPLNEQQEIVEYLDKETKLIDETISSEQKKIELLKEYKQSLISEVVTGKRKVS